MVEVLAVVVILVIIATIVTTVWIHVDSASRDQAREAETDLWINTFETYRSNFAIWPAMPVNSATPTTMCLGNFSSYSNKCGQYGSSTATRYINASGSAYNNMLSAVDRIGFVPVNTTEPTNNSLVGPLLYVTQNSNSAPITVTGRFFHFFNRECPDGWTEYFTSPGSPALPSSISQILTGTGAHACAKTEQFTYSPT